MTDSTVAANHQNPSEPDSHRSPKSIIASISRPSTLLFAGSLVLGLALRIWLTFSAAYKLNSDSSVVYLMSRHIAQGEFPLMFWGQQYGGTTLQLAAGTVMIFTGASVQVFGTVTALFFMAATIVFRQIAVRALGVVWGDLAGILMWFPLSVATLLQIADPGFYGPSLLYGLLIIYLGLSPTRHSRGIVSWVLIGALSGLALWTSPASVAIAAPGVLLALWSDRRVSRWFLAIAAGLVAALPWIVVSLTSHLTTLTPRGVNTQSFASLFTTLIPAAVPFGTDELVAFIVSLLSFAAVVWPVWFGIRNRDTAVFCVGASTILLIASLIFGAGTRLAGDSARYVVFLLPGFSFAAALLFSRLRRGWLMPVVAAIAIAATVTSLGFHGGFQRAKIAPFDTPNAKRIGGDPDLALVADYLTENNIQHAYGSYWLAYNITAMTNEKITVAPTAISRYAPYVTAAATQQPMAVIVYTGMATDALLRSQPGLPPATTRVLGGYTVFIYQERFDIYSLPVGLQ